MFGSIFFLYFAVVFKIGFIKITGSLKDDKQEID
jgi:hypothetical protein